MQTAERLREQEAGTAMAGPGAGSNERGSSPWARRPRRRLGRVLAVAGLAMAVFLAGGIGAFRALRSTPPVVSARQAPAFEDGVLMPGEMPIVRHPASLK